MLSGSWRKIHSQTAAPAAGEKDTAEGGIGFFDWVFGWLHHFHRRTWNFFVGVLFLPFCWMLTDALFSTFARAHSHAIPIPFWQSHEFLMFAAGCAIWLVWFGISIWIWREPRPLRAYVLCHEFTHALTARIFGGRIREFRVTRDGGHIVTDRYNFVIALAPYLWPLPAIPVLAAWGIAARFPESMYHREWFLAALGLAWMFHITFTCWMLPIGQTDFHGPGVTFSFSVIYIVNVLLLTLCMVVLAPEITLGGWYDALVDCGTRFYTAVLKIIAAIWHHLAGK